MTERKEKTMLKWLKQKPTHGQGLPLEKITDDPLATIQVHPNVKNKKNKANEIYAVSRVNPLFEEDGKEVFSPGGNSGSSGYDSGSGPSDDDFPIAQSTESVDLKEAQGGLQRVALKHPQLFINTENDVIHHEAAIVGPNGRPILQILEQNPNFVKSIALSVAGRKRPLSPISESNGQFQNSVQVLPRNPPGTLQVGVDVHTNSKAAKPLTKIPTSTDAVGNAKLIKNPQFVRSIRIGGSGIPTPVNSNALTKRSILEANRRISSSNGHSRRPSVTFADDVAAAGGLRRKPSMEQDSIVTESLLMLTSNDGGRRFLGNSRKASVSSESIKSQEDEHSTTETDEIVSSEEPQHPTVDLEAFAHSLRKSRPIKLFSNLHGSSDELDDISSSSSNPTSEEGYDSNSPPNERRIPTLSRPTSPKITPTSSSRIHNSKVHKSPFGGIADHYAAAKEIAKEIESYSNGSAKGSKKSLVRDLLYRGSRSASSSISTNDNAIKNQVNPVNYGTYNSKNKTSRVNGISNARDGTLIKETRHLKPIPSKEEPEQQVFPKSASSSPPTHEVKEGKNGRSSSQEVITTVRPVPDPSVGNNDWELVRVQQVYVKGVHSEENLQKLQQNHRYHQQLLRKNFIEVKADSSSSSARNNDSDGKTQKHQGQDQSSSGTTSSSARRHPSLASAKTSILASPSRGNPTKKVPPDDGLESGARPRIKIENDDSDSGNSSDRTYSEIRLEIEGAKTKDPGDKPVETKITVEDVDSKDNLPSKVMIVTGDSQNIVVDLSGVANELKTAIVSGTALITLPDGLEHVLQPGYTMITIPASNKTISKSNTDGSNASSAIGNPASRNVLKKDAVTIGIDDNKPLVPLRGSGSDDECKLFASKNKAQIWDVLQNSIGKQHETGGKKKKITVFPFHPNQDAYESPDFTIEGHRLDRQRKRVEMEKKRRCACRLCGMLFFLVAFLGVIVAISMIYTKGQRYFGSV